MSVLIKYENVSVLRKNVVILENLNFTLNSGDFYYLSGAVGSGKSTLLKTMYSELDIHSGNAQVAGFDLCSITKKEIPFLRRKLGIIFQDYQLLSDRNIFDNLKFVLEAAEIKSSKEIRTSIDKALYEVGLTDSEKKMPHQLSGGEQQRAVIARALINRPEIILADEPTGNLDPDSSEKIMKILINISKSGSCVIMATHNYELFNQFPAKRFHIEKKNLSVK